MISGSDLSAKISILLSQGVRQNLIAKGLARVLLWKDGKLPSDSPKFSVELSSDLLEYGYTLLRLSLLLREEQAESELAVRGFERAAEAIEAVIRRGEQSDPARGFHSVVAACSYHLGHFSARSYCLLPPGETAATANLAPSEYALACLLRRSLDRLGDFCREWLQLAENSDEAVAALLNDAESAIDAERVLDVSLTSGLIRALSIFDLSLTTGSQIGIAESIEILQECEEMASELSLVTGWWISKLAKNIVADLWRYSLHQNIPPSIEGDGQAEWPNLRNVLIARLRSKRLSELELWPSQIRAASRTCDMSDDLVVSLPTSAGKTRIAELCILRALAAGKRVAYVTPLRALSAQVERDLRSTFQPLGFTVSSLYGAAGAVGTDTDTLGNRDVVVATPEKLDFALRQAPELLDNVGLIVLDEAHMIGPKEREVRYEVLVQRLLRRSDATARRVVCLSAILPRGDQLTDFVSWIRQDDVGEPVLSDWRPTRQRFGRISWKGSHARLDFTVDGEESFVSKYISATHPTGRRKKVFPGDQQELTLAAAWQVVAEGGSALVFCPQRRSVSGLAKAAIKLHKQGLLGRLVPPSEEILRAKRVAIEWLSESHPAVQCLEIGVAVHHAGLPKAFLREVERLLQIRKLPVTISSPTLAQGLNLSASSLLMFSLHRAKDMIQGEEFANIIGRAGRAWVDIEGQILYVMHEPDNWKVSQWEKLIKAARHRQIRSGLAVLVGLISDKICSALNLDRNDFLEHVVNNTEVWASVSPGTEISSQEDERSQLESEIASLDVAILALIENHDSDMTSLPSLLDEILQGSLWARTLGRASEAETAIASALLRNRAQYIWENSSAVQRKGYFAAGVSLTTGKRLDDVAEEVNSLLFDADLAIERGSHEEAVAALISFAAVVFKIPPFATDEDLPPDWKTILELWIRGEPMSSIVAATSEDAVDFVEDAIVYRLVWAAEAVRVRSKAHGDVYSLVLTGRAAEALEVGSMNQAVMVLLQAGLGSRIAAQAALDSVPGHFSDYEGMRDWMNSDTVRASTGASWPTKESAELWHRFVVANSERGADRWTSQRIQRRVVWGDKDSTLPLGTLLRLVNPTAGPRTDVESADHVPLGRLVPPLPPLAGLLYGEVAGANTVDVRYVGPEKLA